MKAKDVHIGELYSVKVSGRVQTVRVQRENPFGGWDCINLNTNRAVRVRSPQRFRINVTVLFAVRNKRLHELGRPLTTGDLASANSDANHEARITQLYDPAREEAEARAAALLRHAHEA
jgi:hypothetical protein